jgi:hypothetical protein
LHVARRAVEPARAHDVPPLHPSDNGFLEEAGRPQVSRGAVRGELQPLLAALGAPDVSRDACGAYSQGVDGARLADSLTVNVVIGYVGCEEILALFIFEQPKKNAEVFIHAD